MHEGIQKNSNKSEFIPLNFGDKSREQRLAIGAPYELAVSRHKSSHRTVYGIEPGPRNWKSKGLRPTTKYSRSLKHLRQTPISLQSVLRARIDIGRHKSFSNRGIHHYSPHLRILAWIVFHIRKVNIFWSRNY